MYRVEYTMPCCTKMVEAKEQGVIDNNGADANDEKFEAFNLVQKNSKGNEIYYPIKFCPFCSSKFIKPKKTN
jgi:hypothetical protein